MTDRIQFIAYQGTEILLIDVTGCSAREAEEVFCRVPEIVTTRPRRSVLIVTDFTGTSFDGDALRAMEQSAVFDKPFVKKSAFVGAESLPRGFSKKLSSFSGREFPAFATRDEALAWLVKD